MAAFRKIVDCQTQFDWSFERGEILKPFFSLSSSRSMIIKIQQKNMFLLSKKKAEDPSIQPQPYHLIVSFCHGEILVGSAATSRELLLPRRPTREGHRSSRRRYVAPCCNFHVLPRHAANMRPIEHKSGFDRCRSGRTNCLISERAVRQWSRAQRFRCAPIVHTPSRHLSSHSAAVQEFQTIT